MSSRLSFAFISMASIGAVYFASTTGAIKAAGPAALPVQPPPKFVINLDKAQHLSIPKPGTDLKPTLFKLGVQGWIVRIPGARALATPAYANGNLYMGGGYGSHEFYCFNAQSGKLNWEYKTDDDGPTAAVVEDGCVAFNTESCTVFVLDAKTGACKWKEWLGDPLMSQPAISKGKLFIAYPGGQRGHNIAGHRMLCTDLHTGKHLWDKSITADVISAPIVDEDKLYFTCMDGTSFCMNAADGKEIWKKSDGATSAPAIAKGQFVVARKSVSNKSLAEGLQSAKAISGVYIAAAPIAGGDAPYLNGSTNGTIGPQRMDKRAYFQSYDSAVGFGGGAPADAQMYKATSNLGVASVAGAWGYQGARAAYKNGKFFNSQGTAVNAIKDDGKTVSWQAQAKGSFINGQSQVFNPPSLGRHNMYLCSGDGHLVSMKQDNGNVDFMYALPFPISFQPALADGKVYIGSGDGYLVCLDTGNPDADGWCAWGGNAQHNKQD